ncbi:MAG: ribonuclease III family protein [Candidatus Bathyarchaeia archaeon]
MLVHGKSLREILLDRDLAKLGDVYLNFAYSLALSMKVGKPTGLRVSNTVLAGGIRKAGLRGLLPHRLSSHDIGSAGEALAVYGLLKGYITTEDLVSIIKECEDASEAFARIFEKIIKCEDGAGKI